MNQSRTPVPPVDIASQSVAGEEDPGASFDLADVPVPPAAAGPRDPCTTCGGTGLLNRGPCPECEGTGRMPVAAPR